MVRYSEIDALNFNAEIKRFNKIYLNAFSAAYRRGAETADSDIGKEKLQKSIMIKPRKQDIDEYVKYTLALNSEAGKRWQGNIQKIVRSGVRQNLHPNEILLNLQKEFGKAPIYARTIARSETARAAHMGQMALYEERGVEQVEFVAGGGPQMCPECADLDGQIFKRDVAPAIPIHANCFLGYEIPILTENDWKGIGEIQIGDKVMTHKGRFKSVTHVFRDKFKGNPVRIFFQKVIGSPKRTMFVTPTHPFLTQRGWISAEDLLESDKLVCLAKKCKNCNKTIPDIQYASDFCSLSCVSSYGTKKQWENPDIRKKMEIGISKGSLELYERCPEMKFIKTKNANKKVRELVERGEWILQNPEIHIKAQKALGRHNYGSTWSEQKFGWLLSKRGIQFETQYPIPNGEFDSLGRPRYFFVDFGLPEKKIAFECDGKYWHDKERDSIRDEILKHQEWTVIRFDADKIRKNLKEISLQIDRVIQNHDGTNLFTYLSIERIEKDIPAKRTFSTYNIEVEYDESYLARGIVSHNCRCRFVSYSKPTKAPEKAPIFEPSSKTNDRMMKRAWDKSTKTGHEHAWVINKKKHMVEGLVNEVPAPEMKGLIPLTGNYASGHTHPIVKSYLANPPSPNDVAWLISRQREKFHTVIDERYVYQFWKTKKSKDAVSYDIIKFGRTAKETYSKKGLDEVEAYLRAWKDTCEKYKLGYKVIER